MGSYDLTSSGEVFAWLGEDAQRNALWIYYSGSATTATVKIGYDTGTSTNHIVLEHDSTEDADLDLENTSYDTLNELINYINGSVSNWEAGLIYHSSAESQYLIQTGEINALGSDNEVTLRIKDEYLVGKLIERATDFIERYCNRKLMSRDYTKEVYDGNGENRMLLNEYPVTQVARLALGRTNAFSIKYTSSCTSAFVEVDGTNVVLTVDGTGTNVAIGSNTISQLITAIELNAGWECTLINSDYGSYLASEILISPNLFCKDPDIGYVEIVNDYVSDFYLEKGTDEWLSTGILYFSGGFTRGHQNIFVWYSAGFSTAPASLEEACIRLVAVRYNEAGSDIMMKKESKGDYSYERFEFNLADIQHVWPPELKAEIDLFKKRVI